MARTVTFQGNPLNLEGKELRAGDKAPDFTLLTGEMQETKLSDFDGKLKIISVTPSLDTPVCDIQLRRFNEETASLSPDVVVLNVSMDLPFAIARFCAAAGIDKVKVLSDHRNAAFGRDYGLLIRELRLLTRAVVIIDRGNIVRYIEIVPEITKEPDYGLALTELKKLA